MILIGYWLPPILVAAVEPVLIGAELEPIEVGGYAL